MLPADEWRRQMLLRVITRARKRALRGHERRCSPDPGAFDFDNQAHYDPAQNPAAYYAFHDADAAIEDAAALADHLRRRSDPTEE